MPIFTSDGIFLETQKRISNFLNEATTAADIAGTEPQEGPVHDDPSQGYGDQIKDYDIGLKVAQRILDKRATLGTSGFTDLSQLSDIDGFGQDKFDDLVHSFGPSYYGKWETLPDSAVNVVHAGILRTGKALMYAGTAEVADPKESAVWDPEKQGQPDAFDTQEAGQSGTYTDDLFCSHHSFLPDGKLLVNGGAHPGHAHGIKATYIFDPDTKTWTKKSDMAFARWYPTTLTLPDGKVITFSGYDDVGNISSEVEIYDPQNDNWQTLPNTATKSLQIYPGMHLLPDAKILYVTTRWDGSKGLWTNPPKTALFDLSNNTWQDIGYQLVKDRTEGMSVILPPDNKRVMVIGGRGDSQTEVSTNPAEIINFNDPNPQWKLTSNMHYKRRNVNAVLLPTGKVLVCAGIEGFKWGNPGPDPVLTAEQYDPDKDKWTKLADMKIPRLYHSVSLLLPDARVLNLGSVGIGGTNGHDLIDDMEVYSPPYLFRGSRPTISNAPSEVDHGKTFTLETPDANSIKKVVLVRPGVATHHTDTEQRVVPLEFTQDGTNELKVTMPSGNPPHYIAIRGYYMLFILNKKDVPSIAKFILLKVS